jgi:hypothetical protein|tara:strand:+ start:195 stop:581 length:387 start_codon:yes stop_codon:yes gene_type:complete
MSDVSIIKLINGSTLVGKLSVDGDIIEIEHPIELITNLMPVEGQLGEQVHLRPWVSIAEEEVFIVERYNVITMATLQEHFIDGYQKMVDQCYINKIEFETSQDEMIVSDEEVETMIELADAIVNKQIH